MKSCLLVTLSLTLGLLAGCGGGTSSAPLPDTVQNSPTIFVAGVNHDYFPLVPGMRWVYMGTHEGLPRIEEVRALDTPRVIVGVECIAILEEVFDDGVLVEITTEWFAQDTEGNVWKFGEESYELEGSTFELDDDSWIAGQDGALQWRMMSGNPSVGDRFFGFTPAGQDLFEVQSVNEMVVVPAGTFPGSMQVIENPDDPNDTDVILYARGVGRVSETNTDGGVQLISVQGG